MTILAGCKHNAGDERAKRRGVAGEIFMWKIGGAKASTGASLEEVQASEFLEWFPEVLRARMASAEERFTTTRPQTLLPISMQTPRPQLSSVVISMYPAT